MAGPYGVVEARTDQGRMGRTDLPEWYLPKNVVGDIFAKIEQDAPLLGLGRQVPVSMGETVIRGGGTDPEAGQVGGGTSFTEREGGVKPLSGFAFGSEKSFSPIKLATIVTVSEEFLRVNPDGFYSELAGKLSGAVSRAAELAAFHNADALNGTALVGTSNNGSVVGSLAADHVLELDMAANLVDQILAGYDLVVDQDGKNFDFTGFAASPQFRSKLIASRDREGNLAFTAGSGGTPLLVQGPVNLNASIGSLLGLPIAFGKSVHGKVGNYAGTNVKMIGGDFSQFAYGFADQIRVKVSDQAVVRGVSMWETNQVAVLAEATFGWYINDPSAFVAWKDTPASV